MDPELLTENEHLILRLYESYINGPKRDNSIENLNNHRKKLMHPLICLIIPAMKSGDIPKDLAKRYLLYLKSNVYIESNGKKIIGKRLRPRKIIALEMWFGDIANYIQEKMTQSDVVRQREYAKMMDEFYND